MEHRILLHGFVVGNALRFEVDDLAATGDADDGVLNPAFVNESLDDVPDPVQSLARHSRLFRCCARQFRRGGH